MATVDVINAAANGELGFDEVTTQTAPSPKLAETSQFLVFFTLNCSFLIACIYLQLYNYIILVFSLYHGLFLLLCV